MNRMPIGTNSSLIAWVLLVNLLKNKEKGSPEGKGIYIRTVSMETLHVVHCICWCGL